MVSPGQPIFSTVDRRNFNRTLRAALPKLQAPAARRYISRGFRRRASQELKEPPWSVFAASWVWNSADFRGYADLSRDAEMGVRELFEVDLDSEPVAE